jgi:ParB/RepB/Spo0J family partition protein
MTITKQLKLSEIDTSLSSLRITRPGEIEKMSQSLHRSGQMNPVIIRQDGSLYQMLDGFKRFYSAQGLGWEFIESRILEVSLAQGKAIMLSYNHGGRSLLDYDEALVIYSLKSEHLLDQVEISKLTGYSRSWVCRRLALVDKLSPEVQDALRMGQVSNSQARALVKLPRGNQVDVMRCIITHHLTSRDSCLLVEKYLEAVNGRDQQYILSHVTEVISQSLSKDQICDVRLSHHGNRLLKSIELLSLQQNIFRGLFMHHMTGKLSELETAILEEKIEKLKRGNLWIQTAINDKNWKNAG